MSIGVNHDQGPSGPIQDDTISRLPPYSPYGQELASECLGIKGQECLDVSVVRGINAIDEVFELIKNAIYAKAVNNMLEGPVAQKGFKRLT